MCVCMCSLNGQTWLPSESSLICSEHFLEIKSCDDPSFIPGLFPAEIADGMSSELQVPESEKQGMEKDMLRDFGVLQKVVDRLPVLLSADSGGVGPARGRVDTSQLQETFRELACHVCQLLVAHDSELLIEGTVGVTVDGGARVMLLHFSDQVRKTEASNMEESIQNPVSEHIADNTVFRDVAKDASRDGTVTKVQTSIRSSEEKTPAVGSADYGMKMSSLSASPAQYSTASLKILSDLAQQTAATMCTSSGFQTNAAADFSVPKRKAEIDTSMCDRPKLQQTLLRELLCAPLPPKRPCRPVVATPPTAAASVVGDVQPRRPTANSTVLGGMLRTGNYRHELNSRPVSSVYGREMRFKLESGTAVQGGHGIPQIGVDVSSPQFGGNAVRALLRLASEHAATGRHDLLRDNKRRDGAALHNESFTNDGSLDTSQSRDRCYNVLCQNLVGSDIGCPSSESISASQNTARNDSRTAVCSSSEYSPSTVKQEIVDPGYE